MDQGIALSAVPRPRVVVVGISEEKLSDEVLARFSPSVRRFANHVAFLNSDVHPNEIDAAIFATTLPSLRSSVPTLQIGGAPIHPILVKNKSGHYIRGTLPERDSPAREFFMVDNELRPQFERAIREGLLPTVAGPGSKEGLLVAGDSASAAMSLVEDSAGVSMALTYKPSESTSLGAHWWISPSTDRIDLWVDSIVPIWRAVWPDSFPDPTSSWRDIPKWMTTDERSAQSELVGLQKRETLLLAELSRDRERIEEKFEEARHRAEGSSIRLLTEQGDGLVEAVTQALQHLGFEVVDRDAASVANGTNKFEDLRLTSPSHAGWVGIVEVKGYRGGAKSNDLQQVRRASQTFVLNERREPNAMWYVVNQFMDDDPAGRPPVLSSNPEDVEVFEADGGLLLDTSQLFLLLQSSEKVDDIRNRLVNARGQFVA